MLLTRTVYYLELGKSLFTVPGANCREDFRKASKLILDWGQRDSWDEPTGPNFKGDIFLQIIFYFY